MASVNKVIIIGNLGQDPETRHTGGGASVASFSVATKEVFKDQSGEKKENTQWHRITAWNRLGETCAKYLAKGKCVYVEGRLHTRSWVDGATALWVCRASTI